MTSAITSYLSRTQKVNYDAGSQQEQNAETRVINAIQNAVEPNKLVPQPYIQQQDMCAYRLLCSAELQT